jgi:hypothetical protein
LSTVTFAFVGLDEMPTSWDVPCMMDAHPVESRAATVRANRFTELLRSEAL